MKYIFFLCIIFFCVIGAYHAQAHGSGVTLDQVIGDYVVNIEYDAVGGIAANSPIQFAFELFNKDRSQQIEFNNVWVSIASVGENENEFVPPVFSGGIMGSIFPPSGMAFTFPVQGSYRLTLRYEKGNQTLAEATFPLDVLPGKDMVKQGGFFQLSNDVFKGGFMVVVLWLIVWIGRRIMRKKEAT